MKILVLGASGKLGSKIISKACKEGHEVKAFVRNVSNLQVLADLPITIFEGDVLESTTLDKAMIDNIDVVVSAIGPDGNFDNVIEKGMLNIVNAMQKHQISKLIAVGGAGILRDEKYGLQLYSPHFPAFLKPIAEQHLKAWEIVADSGINYTYLCPPRMVDGSFADQYDTKEDFPITVMAGNVSYESCANYIVGVIQNSPFKNKRISINHKLK
jgi:putative NADH-flavin reductase